ncbi:MAG: glycosyltransferase [Rhodobiaceae bacterium]|nr:glycosyltransferase [Rhodobiaceae bacterium]MCC0054627.1 glycosyltransferase [Rhodobiaceae bacterium]
MRVAIVCDWYLPRFGGIENHLRDLTVDLVRAGIDVEVLTPMPGPSTVDGVKVTRLCDETLPDGGYTFPPPPQATSLRDLGFYIDMFFGRRKPTAYQRLRDALTADRFDLAHVHFGNSPFAFAAARHAVRIGLPTITTFHSMIGHFQIIAAFGLRYLLDIPAWPVRHFAVSSVERESLRPLLGAAPVGILHNGTDSAFWADGGTVARPPSGPIEILAASRLHMRKRLGALIDTVVAVANRRGAADFRLTIAGDGPAMDELRRRIERHRADGFITLAGRLPASELRAMHKRSHLFVVPAHLESFCLAALEARCSGLPVLAMGDTGVRDFLEPGKDSILVDDDAALGRALEQFLDDPTLQAGLIDGASLPPEGFDHKDVAAAHIRLYDEILSGGRVKTAPRSAAEPANGIHKSVD